MKQEGLVSVTRELVQAWTPAFEHFLGADTYASLSNSKKKLLTGMAAAQYEKIGGQYNKNAAGALEADFSYLNGDNATMAMNVVNPVAGQHNGFTSQSGTKGSGDRQFLVGICIAIAAKTIGLELVQTVPATSANITVKYLNVVYNGGELNNAANQKVHVVTIDFKDTVDIADLKFKPAQKYVVYHATPDSSDDAKKIEALELKYIKADRKGPRAFIFEIQNAFTATNTSGTLTDVVYTSKKPAIATVIADGKFGNLSDSIDAISAEKEVSTVSNTKAIENYAPNQTTNGMRRTLTRSEADAGTDRSLELELESEAYVIGNRVFTGHISRLQYKRLQEQGIDTMPYLTAAMKNEVSQEVNYQIISAARAYGLTNALDKERQGLSFNTYIGPQSVASIAFDALPYADELFGMDQLPIADQFGDINNLTKTMQYETVASIGTYLCMLITQAAYSIGTDSRYGEADACVVSSTLAGMLAASSNFTKLSDKDVDMTAATGAKLSGYVNGIKVYVDVQIPENCPYVTVLRTNQDVKVDMPGIEGDNILVPGLAYLVKDLISTTELVPEGTGGKKIIMDSETDLIAIGQRPQAGYLTFAFCVQLPGLVLKQN